MMNFPLVTIPSTEVHTVKSSVINQDFSISVALPFHYHSKIDKKYPVIYVLDANFHFGMLVDMVRAMNTRVPFCDELPDAIVVGIGYPNGETIDETNRQCILNRARDFTALRDRESEKFQESFFPDLGPFQTGGGDHFLEFIKNEILPLIETNYRADNATRVLLGHSLGGYFALYSAFKYPNLFSAHVVVSPALKPEREALLENLNATLPGRIYLAVGSRELEFTSGGREAFNRLAQLIRKHQSGEFELIEQIFANLTHCAVPVPAYQAGLVSVMS